MGQIKELAKTFSRKGVAYAHVETGEAYMIYRCELAGSYWFEVFQRRINEDRQIAGVDIPASEAFPSDEAFGKWAWCYKNLSDAAIKAGEIAPHKTMAAKCG